MKEKLYYILNAEDDHSKLSKSYNILNVLFIFISLMPLLFKNQTDTLLNVEAVAVGFFIIDYLLRWYTTDLNRPHLSKTKAYLTYPFTIYAILDFISILPFVTVLNQSLRLFRLFRFVRSLRIFRTVRILRTSKSLGIFVRTIKKQKDSLMIVGGLTLAYIFIAALLVFNIEPDTFPSFLEALVWATSSLTTATYGDIYPTSAIGQIFTIISYLVGVAVIALPSSVITAGYIDEMEKLQGINVAEEAKEKQTDDQVE